MISEYLFKIKNKVKMVILTFIFRVQIKNQDVNITF